MVSVVPRWCAVLPGLLLAASIGRAQEMERSWPEIELSLRGVLADPKFRFRDGQRGVPGTSWRSYQGGYRSDGGLEERLAYPAGALALRFGRERVAVDGWWAGGSGDLYPGRPQAFGGVVVPADGRLEVTYELSVASVGWTHAFEPTSWLRLELGLGVEWLGFDVETSVGETDLSALHPSPRIALELTPFEWLTLRAESRGAYLGFPALRGGRAVVSDDLELLLGLRLTRGPMFLEIGAGMLDRHVEENPGRDAEDALHVRWRYAWVAAGLRF